MSADTGVAVGKYRYTTLDILIIAVIAAIGGVVSAYVVGAWAKFIEGAMGPFGAALNNPFFIFWGIVAVLLVPKPGVAIISSLLTGIVEVVAGSLDGSIVLVFTFLQGVGVELGFLAFRYARSLQAAILGGALAGIGCAICLTLVFGFTKLDPVLLVAFFAALAIADGLIGGILAWVIAQGVGRAGFAGEREAWQRVG
jgi:energy-coupling factor transport system substrate-specific component